MGNYHDQIGADSRPDLSFDGIDALPIKRLDSSRIHSGLFDPFEVQFPEESGPPAFVIITDLFGIAVGDIGKKNNILIVFGINQTNTSQGFRVTMLGLLAGQPDDLVALQAGRGIDRRRGFSIEPQILFGSNDKEASSLMQVVQAFVIQIRTVHNVDAAGHDWNHIQDVDVVGPSVRYVNKRRYSAFQVHQCMEFDRGFLLSKLCPWEQRQAQVNGRGVQGFHRFGDLVFAIKLLSMNDQYHSQVMINLPGAVCIGIGQGAEWYVGFDAHMIATRPQGIEGGSEVSEAIAEGELSEAHAKELIPAFKFLCTIISFVLSNYFSKIIFRNNIHKLCKNDFTGIHKYWWIYRFWTLLESANYGFKSINFLAVFILLTHNDL
jgi:hypothetical protein